LDLPDVPAGPFESGLTEAVVGDLVHFDHSYEITNLDLLGGQVLLDGVALHLGQTLTMAELNRLVFTPGAIGNAQIQVEATADGGDTDVFTITLNVTGGVDDFHFGTDGNDRLDGGDGNDYIDGRGGADEMLGGGGDDIFIIAEAGDTAVEKLNGGTDEVRTFINYTLAANIENARALGQTGVALGGNGLDNKLTGNSAANNLTGRAGDDVIDGKYGNDILNGNMDNDTFVFSTALNRTKNVDRIFGFDRLDDQIQLSSNIFSKAGPDGLLAAAAFKLGASATDASDRIIYNQSTGEIFYDADGTGAAAQVLFAVIANKSALRAADFEII
jgi:Ca2+-binding RTX toxin-like protein